MAQVNIPESIGRTLYYNFFNFGKDFCALDLQKDTWRKELKEFFKKVEYDRFVVKPDHTIGKRGKNNLLGIGFNKKGVEEFLENGIKEFNGKTLYRYIIVPFVTHSDEFYISISTKETVDEIVFSHVGGIDIEENWHNTRKTEIDVLKDEKGLTHKDLSSLLSEVSDEKMKASLFEYIIELLAYFRAYGFAFLEINPLVYVEGEFLPLDFKGRLDNCAFFNLQKSIDIYSLLNEVEEHKSPQEEYIKKLDDMTGASLKLKVLNENAKVWPMVAGGGASIIYFDELVAMGLGDSIGFYGEYSGNPSFELTYAYAKTIIEMLLKSTAKDKVLLIAGANANFTDIPTTFKGIQKAIEENNHELKKQKVKILVRRGGPNVKEGFKNMKNMAEKLGIDIILEGTENPLPHVLQNIEVEKVKIKSYRK